MSCQIYYLGRKQLVDANVKQAKTIFEVGMFVSVLLYEQL